VAADVLGAWGRAMLEALVGGPPTPQVLAELARAAANKLPALQEALQGQVGCHHWLLVAELLAPGLAGGGHRRRSARPPGVTARSGHCWDC
jgi:hypothetical protein